METTDKKNSEVVAKISMKMLSKNALTHQTEAVVEGKTLDVLQLYGDLTKNLLEQGVPVAFLAKTISLACAKADKEKELAKAGAEMVSESIKDLMQFLDRALKDLGGVNEND